jgi:hypothetical protein
MSETKPVKGFKCALMAGGDPHQDAITTMMTMWRDSGAPEEFGDYLVKNQAVFNAIQQALEELNKQLPPNP